MGLADVLINNVQVFADAAGGLIKQALGTPGSTVTTEALGVKPTGTAWASGGVKDIEYERAGQMHDVTMAKLNELITAYNNAAVGAPVAVLVEADYEEVP